MSYDNSWLAALAALAFVAPVHANSVEGESETAPAAVPAGMWWGDYDADGLRDAYTISLAGVGKLLRNAGDGTFQDVTVQAGLQAVVDPSLAVWHDYDRDGDSDLYLGTATLMQNAGDGTFVSVSERVGIAHAGRDLGAEWVDYDQDGLVDLFVRTDLGDHVYHALPGGSFETVVLAANAGAVEIGPLGNSEASETPDAGNASTGKAPSGKGNRPASVRTILASGETVPVGTLPPEAASNGNVGPFGFALPICADLIVDQTSLACIEADSTPTLGRLYPLSTDFNLNPATGEVRINGTGASTGFRLDVNFGSVGAVRGVGTLGPTNGYLGVQGQASFDGIATANWSGQEIGVAGISTGASTTDNYGVRGHSNGVGVRGEHSTAPGTDFGELGLSGIGLRASGATLSADLLGDVDLTGSLELQGTVTPGIYMHGSGTVNPIRNILAHSPGFSTWGLFYDDGTDNFAFSSNSGARSVFVDLFDASVGIEYANPYNDLMVAGIDAASEATVRIGHADAFNEARSGMVIFEEFIDNYTGQTFCGIAMEHDGSANRLDFVGSCTVPSDILQLNRSGTVNVPGTFTAGSKLFVHPHPTDPSKQINFVCLEGNENGTYFRGSSKLASGKAVIPVPEEFRLVTKPDGLTVQLTPMGDARVWVERKGLDAIVVRGSADIEFDYMVNGLRQGFVHEAIVDNTNFVPEQAGVPYGATLPDGLRRILQDNGTLDADFTPNLITAQALGWELEGAPEVPLAVDEDLMANPPQRQAAPAVDGQAAAQKAQVMAPPMVQDRTDGTQAPARIGRDADNNQ